MADNKQYISQKQTNGDIMISEDVVATIVEHAIHEVEGVIGLSTKPGSDIAELIGKKNWGKGMKITIAEDNVLHVDCNVIVVYGQSVVAVAQAIQESITAALESMTGVKVGSVHVNICGISAQ